MINRKLAVTIGNPNGVGPEVLSKAFKKLNKEELSDIILIGERDTVSFYFKDFKDLNFINISPDKKDGIFQFKPGERSLSSGYLSYKFIEKAVELAKNKEVGGIVTAPISKELIVNAGITGFIDHTSFLADEFHAEHFNMLFYSEDLKVLLVTIHIPLDKVSQAITRENVESSIQNAMQFLRKYKEKDFRIAVCGINPHAGENGLMGNDDKTKILPVVEKYQKEGYCVEGPLPADSVFYKAGRGEYDIVIAMYHDQGLAPFKLLHFMDGVNVTLGLPVVRTSPDHGTAFDIAGRGVADESSMLNAIRLAEKLL